MDWVDYREILGIGLADKEKYDCLIVNIFNVLHAINGVVSENTYMHYCMLTGTESVWDDCYIDNNYYQYIINELTEHKNDIKEFLSYYVIFANLANKSGDSTSFGIDDNVDYIKVLKKQLEILHIDYDLINDKDGEFLFPKGVAQFDKELVTEVLLWLEDYPNSKKAWINSLKQYANLNTDEHASEVADLFRKTLETFFKEFFKCNKSLENLFNEYGEYLQDNEVPKEVANHLVGLLKLYTAYNNNYAKHNDKTKKNVLEFIMYQTGNIIRLLIQLRQ